MSRARWTRHVSVMCNRHYNRICQMSFIAVSTLLFGMVVVDLIWTFVTTPRRYSQSTSAYIFDPMLADSVWNSSLMMAAAFRWKDPVLYPLSSFSVEFRRTSCGGKADTYLRAEDVTDDLITDVFCGQAFSAHWGHFAEYLFPCWSHFQPHPAAKWHLLTAPIHRPGIDGYKLEAGTANYRQRLQMLNIQMVSSIYEKECAVYKIVLKLPPRRNGLRANEGVVSFLNRSHAAALREAVLRTAPPPQDPADLPEDESVFPRQPWGGGSLRVGFLHRRGSRQLLSLDRLRDRWGALYPSHRFSELTDIAEMPFVEQCRWVRRQHLIVGPHGAQLTNVFCGSPCAVLLELYPRRYFIPGWFPPLAVHLDMVAFGLYPYAADPYADSEPCFAIPLCREFAKAQPVHASPLILDLLPDMLRARQECCDRLQLPNCHG